MGTVMSNEAVAVPNTVSAYAEYFEELVLLQVVGKETNL